MNYKKDRFLIVLENQGDAQKYNCFVLWRTTCRMKFKKYVLDFTSLVLLDINLKCLLLKKCKLQ